MQRKNTKSSSGTESNVSSSSSLDEEEREVERLEFVQFLTNMSQLESTHKIVQLNRVPFVVSMRVIRPTRNAITSDIHHVTTSNHTLTLNGMDQALNQNTMSLLDAMAQHQQQQHLYLASVAGGSFSSLMSLNMQNQGVANQYGGGGLSINSLDVPSQLQSLMAPHQHLTREHKEQSLRLLLSCTNGSDEYYECDLGFEELQEHRKKISMNHLSWSNYLKYLRNGLFYFGSSLIEKQNTETGVNTNATTGGTMALSSSDDPTLSHVSLQFDEENKESKDVIQLIIYSPLNQMTKTTAINPQATSSSETGEGTLSGQKASASSSNPPLSASIRLKFLFELYAIRHVVDFTQKVQQLLFDLVSYNSSLSEVRLLKDAKLISDLRRELQETKQKLRQAQDRLILYQPGGGAMTSSTSGGVSGDVGSGYNSGGSSNSDHEKKTATTKRKAPKSLINPNQKRVTQTRGAKIQ
ncbi:hypothetical protein C9374_005996 [Naegleria lovaniensis]|uniref:Uncharacterized protein n=1 Tax=Naegleria lovaniensis TaxID=51637 RepID=A0AA88GNL8_NAELO|nr:uncharacterized protein C9374_014214 [Naegleria lovaniensis]XP_044547292.1 uncharacterized protein C9374_005996 [Naegleria lovaniensis]KAG2370799.1 hypothetical protein C9374_014214 [Naegleria lovaniensis]KAG2381612.1 hypothetical protein C9374_005996 [Naegleria lovaniensis]